MNRLLPAFLAATFLGGCFTFSQPAPVIREYRLDYPAPAAAPQALPAILNMAPLTVSATYDGETIVYRTTPYVLGRQFYERWATNPGLMVSDLLARDFTTARVFRAVQQGATPVGSDYRLSGTLEEIEQRHVDGRCEAHLSVRILLIRLRRSASEPVLLQRHFSAAEPCSCDDMADLSAAMSRALQRLSAEVVAEVGRAARADLPASAQDRSGNPVP